MNESPNERAWRAWQTTQDHRYQLDASAAFDAGTRHGIEFANGQLADEPLVAALNRISTHLDIDKPDAPDCNDVCDIARAAVKSSGGL